MNPFGGPPNGNGQPTRAPSSLLSASSSNLRQNKPTLLSSTRVGGTPLQSNPMAMNSAGNMQQRGPGSFVTSSSSIQQRQPSSLLSSRPVQQQSSFMMAGSSSNNNNNNNNTMNTNNNNMANNNNNLPQYRFVSGLGQPAAMGNNNQTPLMSGSVPINSNASSPRNGMAVMGQQQQQQQQQQQLPLQQSQQVRQQPQYTIGPSPGTSQPRQQSNLLSTQPQQMSQPQQERATPQAQQIGSLLQMSSAPTQSNQGSVAQNNDIALSVRSNQTTNNGNNNNNNVDQRSSQLAQNPPLDNDTISQKSIPLTAATTTATPNQQQNQNVVMPTSYTSTTSLLQPQLSSHTQPQVQQDVASQRSGQSNNTFLISDQQPSLSQQSSLPPQQQQQQQQPSNLQLQLQEQKVQNAYNNNNTSQNVDDEEDEDYDEDEDEDEEVEETEPILRYQRLPIFKPIPPKEKTNKDGSQEFSAEAQQKLAMEKLSPQEQKRFKKLLERKTLSATYCHEKFLLIGTSGGILIQYDLQGNEIMRMQCHTAGITCISSDLQGDNIATGALDGSVTVTNIFTKEQSNIKFTSSILSLCISPHFKTQQTVAVGLLNGQLVICAKGWLSFKNNVIHEGDGPISSMVWHGDSSLLAWSTNKGIKVLDISKGERISFIVKPPNGFGDEVGAIPHMIWARPDVLAIGWGNTVKVCQLRHRDVDSLVGSSRVVNNNNNNTTKGYDNNEINIPGTSKSSRFMQVIAMFEVDDLISGISVVKEFIALLVCHYEVITPAHTVPIVDDDGNEIRKKKVPIQYKMLPPDLRLVSYQGIVQSSDSLVLTGFNNTLYKQLRLVSLPVVTNDPLLYISNHSDLFMASVVPLDEKILWLYSHNHFTRGLMFCTDNFHTFPSAQRQWFVEVYLWNLLRQQAYAKASHEAVRLLPSIKLLNIDNLTIRLKDYIMDNTLLMSSLGSNLEREKLINIIYIWEFWLSVFIFTNTLNIFINNVGPLIIVNDPSGEVNCMCNNLYKFSSAAVVTSRFAQEAITLANNNNNNSSTSSSTPQPQQQQQQQQNLTKYTIQDIIHRYMEHLQPQKFIPKQNNNNNNANKQLINTIYNPILNNNNNKLQLIDLDNEEYDDHPLLPSDGTYQLNSTVLLNHSTSLSSTFFQQPVTFPEYIKNEQKKNNNNNSNIPTTTLTKHCYDDETQLYRIVALPITPIQWRYQHHIMHKIMRENNVNFSQQSSTTPLAIHSHMFTTILLQLLKENAISLVAQLIEKYPTTSYNYNLIIQALYKLINKLELSQLNNNNTNNTNNNNLNNNKNNLSNNNNIATPVGVGNSNFISVEQRIANIHVSFERLTQLTSNINIDLIPIAYQNKESTISQFLHYSNNNNTTNNNTNTDGNNNIVNIKKNNNNNNNNNGNNDLNTLYSILLHIFLQQKQYVEVVAVCALTGNPLLFDFATPSSSLSSNSKQRTNGSNVESNILQYIQPYILELALLYPYQCINMLTSLYKVQTFNNTNNNNNGSNKKNDMMMMNEHHTNNNNNNNNNTNNNNKFALTPAYIIDKLQLVPYLLFLYFSAIHRIEINAISSNTGPVMMSSATSIGNNINGTSNIYNQSIVNTFIHKVLPCYIRFAPDNELLHFLRTNTVYKLETAVALCVEYHRDAPLVFLYHRTGNLREAILLLLSTSTNLQQNGNKINQQIDDNDPTILSSSSNINNKDGQLIETNNNNMVQVMKPKINLNNVKRAIEIVIESNDMSLWDLVFSRCLKDIPCLTYLLDYASMFLFAVNTPTTMNNNNNNGIIMNYNYNQMELMNDMVLQQQQLQQQQQQKVDVIALLNKIPKDMHIPNFHQILHTIVHNAYLHLSLTQTVYKSAQHDYSKESIRYLRAKRKGTVVSNEQIGLRRLLQQNRASNGALMLELSTSQQSIQKNRNIGGMNNRNQRGNNNNNNNRQDKNKNIINTQQQQHQQQNNNTNNNKVECVQCGHSILSQNEYQLTHYINNLNTLTNHNNLDEDGFESILPIVPTVCVFRCCSATICATCANQYDQKQLQQIRCPNCF